MGQPFTYPTGVTRYNANKCFSGYTLINALDVGAVLFDMRGNVVRVWEDLQGFPNKLLPGGYVLGSLGQRDGDYGYQDQTDLVQVDWDGKIVWKFDRKEWVTDPSEEQWMARQHHDYQREGNPVGYYVPGMEAQTNSGNTLILCHENLDNARITDKNLMDDVFIEVDWEGNILWQWRASDHFHEFGFSDVAKLAIAHNPNMRAAGGGMGDWAHINCMSVLGPNRWYDGGDERFHPDNIIFDSREANFLAIISKETGKVVWQMGPDFTDKMERRMGQIIGPHHLHMIPKGLPGEGNLLVFDNGGWSGYGTPNNISRDGTKVNRIDRSRVIEFNPVTKRVVWELKGSDMEDYGGPGIHDYRFYSPLTSSAQRLPNGNTLVTEGVGGRLFEVTADKEVVWEFISPFGPKATYIYYRGYRYPYDYVPQLPIPEETSIPKIDVKTFRVPGAAPCVLENFVKVKGTWGYPAKVQPCVNIASDEAIVKKIVHNED